MPRTCKGFGSSCWFPIRAGSLCASCYLREQRATFEEFIKIVSIPSSDPFQLFKQSNSLFWILKIPGSLDRLLSALYSRPRKQALKSIITHIRQRSNLFTQFLLRVRYHTDTFCPVYSWCIRNDLLPELIMPYKCLHCLSHTVSYVPSMRFEIIRILRFYNTRLVYMNRIPSMRSLDRGKELAIALFEQGVEKRILDLLLELVPSAKHDIEAHPFTIEDLVKKGLPTHLTERMDRFRDELLSRTWHPDRVLQWCLDIEEQERIGIWIAARGGGECES